MGMVQYRKQLQLLLHEYPQRELLSSSLMFSDGTNSFHNGSQGYGTADGVASGRERHDAICSADDCRCFRLEADIGVVQHRSCRGGSSRGNCF